MIFSAAMVRAILNSSKTQTRRIVKPQPPYQPMLAKHLARRNYPVWHCEQWQKFCPYGQPGDRLWVRESGWQPSIRSHRDLRNGADTWPAYAYDADGISEGEADDFKAWEWKRRPSIYMPRWASRITLEIVDVRVERLQDISEADVFAEGVKITVDAEQTPLLRLTGKFPPSGYIKKHGLVVAEYASLWETINGPGSWALNPWVWVIEFRSVKL